MAQTDFSGPVQSNAGFKVGSTEVINSSGEIVADVVVASSVATAAAPALSPEGSTAIDSSANAVNATLGAGSFIGQIKVIVMTEASNSSTVTIANHQTSDPEVATFDAVDETGVFMWTGTEWVTIFATCTFV